MHSNCQIIKVQSLTPRIEKKSFAHLNGPICLRREVAEVIAAAKVISCAGHHRTPHLWVLCRLFQRLHPLVVGDVGQCVVFLWPVELDHQRSALPSHLHRRVGRAAIAGRTRGRSRICWSLLCRQVLNDFGVSGLRLVLSEKMCHTVRAE